MSIFINIYMNTLCKNKKTQIKKKYRNLFNNLSSNGN